MSGGVDSSVAALLLARQGNDISGVFMQNWEEEGDGPCPALADARDAMAVCQKLGIEFDAINFAREYWQQVFTHFLAEFEQGRTPNPDILCNREIKFRAFLDHALATGAEAVATGHYARIRETDDGLQLLKGRDPGKDQSYFLHCLDQYQLAHARFPLGEMHKTEVRSLAQEAGLANHAKKDSTGICFIGERHFRSFLARYLPASPGEIRSIDGVLLGEHQGLMYYTIGQRQGLGIGGRQGQTGDPWYVAMKSLADNILYVVQGHDHPCLFSSRLETAPAHWIAATEPVAWPLVCQAKTRYRQADQACRVVPVSEGRLSVTFEQPQRAITPGQSIVFYQGDVCLGGAVIESTPTQLLADRPAISAQQVPA